LGSCQLSSLASHCSPSGLLAASPQAAFHMHLFSGFECRCTHHFHSNLEWRLRLVATSWFPTMAHINSPGSAWGRKFAPIPQAYTSVVCLYLQLACVFKNKAVGMEAADPETQVALLIESYIYCFSICVGI
jgi:hypothetical protein